MDQNQETKVKAIVAGLIASGEMFSAFDVTKVMRNIENEQVKHFEVRDIVHSEMASASGFVSNLETLPNGAQAIVWRPCFQSDMTQYPYDSHKLGNAGDPSPALNAPASPLPTMVPAQASNSPSFVPAAAPVAGGSAVGRKVDKSGRYCVRQKSIMAIGLLVGEPAYVTAAAGEIRVFPAYPIGANLTDVFKFIVDRDCNVRLTRRVLAAAAVQPQNIVESVEKSLSGDEYVCVQND